MERTFPFVLFLSPLSFAQCGGGMPVVNCCPNGDVSDNGNNRIGWPVGA